MIPRLWCYLTKSYLRILTLSLCAFVGVLIVMRLQEIARFATSGASLTKVLLFAALQIPYILPLAMPISCLIATFLLFQRLSSSHELTALRSCGIGIGTLKTPLIYLATCVSLLNFTIASEIGPHCRALSKELIVEVVKANPLFLLQRDSLIKLKNAYYHIGNLKGNSCAKDILLATRNGSNDTMTLIVAKELNVKNSLLIGDQVAFISSIEAHNTTPGFDHLMIENQTHMETPSEPLTDFLQLVGWETHINYLRLHDLLAYSAAKGKPLLANSSVLYEIARRFSIGLAPLTLTLLGLAYGIHIGRRPSKKGLMITAALTALFLSAFIAAKSFEDLIIPAMTIFLIPHLLIITVAMRKIRSIDRGIE